MKAIVFDFDGTIANTLPAITVGVNLALTKLGLPTHTEREVTGFINHGARELIRHALPANLQDDAAFVDHALKVYHGTYSESYLLTKEPYPGIAELISDLHRTYRIGVLSNKQSFLLAALTAQVLPAGSYDAVQGFEDGHPAKPDPYLTRKIASSLGVEPAECIMVGDSDVDLLTARNAGMYHIGVSWGYRSAAFLRTAGATRVAASVPELAAFIAAAGARE